MRYGTDSADKCRFSFYLQSVNYDTSQPDINLFFNFKFEQKFNQHGD